MSNRGDAERLADIQEAIDRIGTYTVLCGGDKSSQTADIKRAKALWSEWKRRQR
jgi:hypothetical protein